MMTPINNRPSQWPRYDTVCVKKLQNVRNTHGWILAHTSALSVSCSFLWFLC